MTETVKKHSPEYCQAIADHIKEVGIGMIGGQTQPYGILVHELDKKVEIGPEFGDRRAEIETLRAETLKRLTEMMADHNGRHSVGANRPPAVDPEVLADFESRAKEFAEAGGLWLDKGKIEDAETAAKAGDFLRGARQLFKQVEDERKKQKEPHLEAGKAVDAAFEKVKAIIEKTAGAAKRLLDAFAAEEEKRVRAEQAAAAKAAAEARAKAEEEARAAAARNDIIGEAEAEAALKAAAKAEKAAAKVETVKVGSATGAGKALSYRTIRSAKLVSAPIAFSRYRAHPEVVALLERLATAELRAKDGPDKIDGFEIVTERKVA